MGVGTGIFICGAGLGWLPGKLGGRVFGAGVGFGTGIFLYNHDEMNTRIDLINWTHTGAGFSSSSDEMTIGRAVLGFATGTSVDDDAIDY